MRNAKVAAATVESPSKTPIAQRADIPTEGFMRLPAVLAVYPVSRSSWWEMVRKGRAPKPYTLGRRCTVWKAVDIRALIEATAPKAAP